jgi:hypothetical protein
MADSKAVARAFIAGHVEAGDEVFVQAWADDGGRERWDRIQRWLADQRSAMVAALLA